MVPPAAEPVPNAERTEVIFRSAPLPDDLGSSPVTDRTELLLERPAMLANPSPETSKGRANLETFERQFLPEFSDPRAKAAASKAAPSSDGFNERTELDPPRGEKEKMKPFGEETFLFKNPPLIPPKPKAPRDRIIQKALKYSVGIVGIAIVALLAVKYLNLNPKDVESPKGVDATASAPVESTDSSTKLTSSQRLLLDRGNGYFMKLDADSFEQANAFYEQALRIAMHPTILGALAKNQLYWGIVSKDPGRIILALDFLHQARDLSLNDDETYRALAYYHLAQNRPEQAKRYLDRVKDGSHPETELLTAQWAVRTGKSAEAIAALRRVLAAEREWVLAHQLIVNLGRSDPTLVTAEERERSKKVLDRHAVVQTLEFLDIEPKRPPGMQRISTKLDASPPTDKESRELPPPNEALVQANKDKEANQELARNLFRQGENYLKRKNVENAIQAFQKASTLDPEWAAPHRKLGEIYMSRKDNSNARRAFKTFVSLAESSRERREVQTILRRLQ